MVIIWSENALKENFAREKFLGGEHLMGSSTSSSNSVRA